VHFAPSRVFCPAFDAASSMRRSHCPDPKKLAAAAAYLTNSLNDPLAAARAPMPAIQQLAALYAGPGTGSAAADALALDIMRVNWRPMVEASDGELASNSPKYGHIRTSSFCPSRSRHPLGDVRR
jgi:hypothetical protein